MEQPFRAGWFDLAPATRSAEIGRCAAAAAAMGPRLNATVCLSPARRAPSGPLMGMPYVTKDIFDRAARRAEWGGCRTPGPAEEDAAILHRLDAAGGCEVAVTSLSALAYEPSGYNATLGRTRNPWHPGIVSGGSSSGSAVMVATGAAYLGVGSDTGGSVRVPAACCGIVGLKPGWGILPDAGAMPLAPSLDVIGFMARRAGDLLRVWSALTSAADVSAIRALAVLDNAVSPAAEPVRRALLEALGVLDRAGIRHAAVDCTDLMAAADAAALTIMQAEAARIHGTRGSDAEPADPALMRRIGKGLAISDAALAAARDEQPRLRDAFLTALGGADAAVLPVMPFPTPLASAVDPRDADFAPRTLYAMTSLTRFVNALGLPAIALPVGFDRRGTPLAMQVIGRPGGEMALLRLAATYQSLTRWDERRPPVCTGASLEARCA
ncbi:amidase [Xanthobacter sp. KR7-65]|uniref:amidase n=1 Tax=Xanthobacter sp. KR7-65 TaxID=3156612 RepID=UPI0032B436AA